jgi:ABC-type branched-subunit amino acid transport system substrate-binding protein
VFRTTSSSGGRRRLTASVLGTLLSVAAVALFAVFVASGANATEARSAAGHDPLALGPQGFSFNPAAEAAACKGTKGNRASDVGVTPTSITFGNVSGITGPFEAASDSPDAVKALFDAINKHGGICGRQLKLSVQDDGEVASRNASEISDMSSKVFAFVGSHSTVDGAGAAAMTSAHVPDIGSGVNDSRTTAPNYWTAAPGNGVPIVNGHHYLWNTLELGLKKYNDAPKQLALAALAYPISVESAEDFATAFTKYAGTNICYRMESITPATASLDQAVLALRDNHCDGVFSATDIPSMAKVLTSLQRQHLNLKFVMSEGDEYSPEMIKTAGNSATKGLQIFLWFAPFDDKTPMMTLYKSQLAAAKAQLSYWSVLAWSDAQMLVYALTQVGHNPTRANVQAIFRRLHSWTTGGMTAPFSPAAHSPAGQCIVDVINTGDPKRGYFGYVRKWPPHGFFCTKNAVIAQVK